MSSLLATFEKAALLAGAAILDLYVKGSNTRYKSDSSPVTEADERAERIILSVLAEAMPHLPVVAEESVAAGRIPSIEGGSFILVDPLDGTKEFINNYADFTVNIALIEDGAPVQGIVYAPALNVAYIGGNGKAEKLVIRDDFQVESRCRISARPVADPPVCVASRSHLSAQTQAYLEQAGAANICAVGSSLKFCLIAEGLADLYPRFGPTMEWDTAAGDAVLRGAGGCTVDIGGIPLRYGKIAHQGMAAFANPDFVAWGMRPALGQA